MTPPTDSSLLLTFYFGETAPIAKKGASMRLKKWSRAFDTWIHETTTTLRPDTTRHALLAWKRLIHHCPKLPWLITPDDIQHHLAWMQEQDFSTSTINNTLSFVASFYTWCDAHHVDPATPSGFNPALAVPRLPKKPYAGATLWTQSEVDAFFHLLAQDESPLGKRDHAFFLLRLHTGVVLKRLQHLKWSQLDQPLQDMHVRWRSDSPPFRLPPQVQQAILDYLRLSGRLDGMAPAKLIFAPLALPSLESPRTSAADWSELQPISTSALLSSLKLYGRQVGIPHPKLTLITLRRTAIQRKADQGESLPAMQAFMDTREKLKQTRYRLAQLQHVTTQPTSNPPPLPATAPLPVRTVQNYKPLNHLLPPFDPHPPDPQAIQAIIQEDIKGLADETSTLRQLMQGIYNYPGDSILQMRAYSLAAQRLAFIISARVDHFDDGHEELAAKIQDTFDTFIIGTGFQPDPADEPRPLGSYGPLTQEIATIRWLLRDAYTHATQSLTLTAYLHQLDLYGIGCVRLARLLKVEHNVGGEQLVRDLKEGTDMAIRDLRKEWGLDK